MPPSFKQSQATCKAYNSYNSYLYQLHPSQIPTRLRMPHCPGNRRTWGSWGPAPVLASHRVGEVQSVTALASRHVITRQTTAKARKIEYQNRINGNRRQELSWVLKKPPACPKDTHPPPPWKKSERPQKEAPYILAYGGLAFFATQFASPGCNALTIMNTSHHQEV